MAKEVSSSDDLENTLREVGIKLLLPEESIPVESFAQKCEEEGYNPLTINPVDFHRGVDED